MDLSACMTVLHTTLWLGVCCQPASVRGDALYRQRTLPDRTAYHIFFKIYIGIRRCPSFRFCIHKRKTQNKLYRPLAMQFFFPIPSLPLSLPRKSPTNQQSSRHEKFVYIFSGLSCFCARDRKTH